MLKQSNLAKRLTGELPDKVARLIKAVGKAAADSEYNSYLVGGFVRDLILQRPSKDLDVMIEGDALAVARNLAHLSGPPVMHARFGTATLKSGDYRIDLATCRSETYAKPGALPAVKPGTIEQDLFRRDFTINAIAVRIGPRRFGDVIDLYGGHEDLDNKLVRILHNRSFTDDATRIMRAVRYEQRLGFTLEGTTARLLKRDLKMLDTISGDRLRRELILWLEEPDPGIVLKRASELGILAKFSPSLKWNTALEKGFKCAGRITGTASPVHLYLALLAYCVGPAHFDGFIMRLNISGETALIARQATLLREEANLFGTGAVKPSDIYFRLRDYNVTAIAANAIMTRSKAVHENSFLYLAKLRHVKTRLTGDDLAKLGVPRGRKTGEILNKLLAARLDGVVKTKADEHRLALRLIR